MSTNNNGQTAQTAQNGQAQQNGQQPGNAVVQVEKNIADNVLNKIKLFEETGTLNIPKKYSASNALRIGWLILQETKTGGQEKRPVLEVCTKESIANALLRMIILGLNPAKRQCSFVAYGNQLTCQREYQGTVTIAKRHGVKEVTGCAVFKGDVFEYIIDPTTGNKTVTKHDQKLENIEEGVVIAAYATKEYEDGRKVTEIMAMSQIRKAWMQGPTKGESPAHKNFPDEMAIKTVKNRLLKPDVNASDDSDLFDEGDDMPTRDVVSSNVQLQITENANKKEIGFDEAEVTDKGDGKGTVDTNTGEVTEQVQKAKAPF
jgi:recombination protein RecT